MKSKLEKYNELKRCINRIYEIADSKNLTMLEGIDLELNCNILQKNIIKLIRERRKSEK